MRALRDPDAWDAWLHRLTVRACYRWRAGNGAGLVELHVVPDPEPAGAHGLRRMPLVDRDRLERELGRLPIDQRAVIVLHFYLDLPLAEVAGDPRHPRRDRQVPAAPRPGGAAGSMRPVPVDGLAAERPA